jgi:GTP cyclohydrolase I
MKMKENELTVSSRINGNNHVRKDSSLFKRPENNEPLWTSSPAHNDELKIKKISAHFREIMLLLGLDLEDDSLQGTPDRVAKMYVKEMFQGLDPKKEPKITLFENTFQYNEMLVEKNIRLNSCCEHHFVPIVGKVHVGYFSSGKLIGLSKINRIVSYYSKRPQLQERLTEQIADALKNALSTNDVAVVINAAHMCLTTRGITDSDCKTLTSHYSGKFKNEEVKKEFISYLEKG